MKAALGLFFMTIYPSVSLAVDFEISYAQTRNSIEISEKKLSFLSNRIPTIELELKGCNKYAFNRLKLLLENLKEKDRLGFAAKRAAQKNKTEYLPIEIKLPNKVYRIDAEEKLGLSYFQIEKKFEEASLESILVCENKDKLKSFLKKSFDKRRENK